MFWGCSPSPIQEAPPLLPNPIFSWQCFPVSKMEDNLFPAVKKLLYKCYTRVKESRQPLKPLSTIHQP